MLSLWMIHTAECGNGRMSSQDRKMSSAQTLGLDDSIGLMSGITHYNLRQRHILTFNTGIRASADVRMASQDGRRWVISTHFLSGRESSARN